jgi:hypothetical protein
MSVQALDAETRARRERYVRELEKRARQARRDVFLLRFGVQLSWAVSLVAGAAISLVQAFGENVGWSEGTGNTLTAVLGFVVVVAQGADRLLSRGARGAAASDLLHRTVERERRTLEVGEGPYRGAVDPFSLFVDRMEAALLDDDKAAIRTTQRLLDHNN